MTVIGYNQTKPVKSEVESTQNSTELGLNSKWFLKGIIYSELDPVYLKCFIKVPEKPKLPDNNDGSRRTDHTHKPHTTPSKMKRKYQKRKRRSDCEDDEEEQQEDVVILGPNFINCSVYPSHKVNI